MTSINKQAEDFNARSPESFGCEPPNPLVKTRDLKPGEVIERYKIIRMVGRGAIGSVYEVEQIYMHRRFALKTLNPIAHTDVAMRRFQQEAKAAGRLEHPNLVRAVDFGMIDETQPFLVMDFLEGQTLSEYLKTHARMPVEEALNIFIPVAFSLAYAHSEGVIHRDIKPSNIVLTMQDNKMVPKVVDFGIAKVDQTEALTRTGEVFGTPLYMSPEQCSGIKVDQRTDIYALGCVLFEVLTGTPPLRGTSALETMMQHSTSPVPSMREASLGLEFSRALERIIGKMLAKDPDQRYQDFLQVADHLACVQQGQEIDVAVPKGPAKPVAAKVSSKSRVIGNVLLVLAGAIICGAVVVICQLVLHQAIEHRQAEAPAVLQRQAKAPDEVMLSTTLPDQPDESIRFPEHFSHTEMGQRVFRFPAVRTIGFLRWAEGGRLQDGGNLMGAEVRTPLSCKYICFNPSPDSVYLQEKVPSRFQDGDLQGLVWTPGSDNPATDEARVALAGYTKIRSLRYILIRDIISPAALENIGKLPNLRWLIVDRPGQLSDAQLDDQGQLGAFLSQMPSINHLKVFGLNRVLNVGPILQQLTQNPSLLRLQLRHEDLTRSDLTYITQMKHLQVLDYSVDRVRPSVADCHWFWNKLAKMPHLQSLCIDQKYLGIGRDGKPLPELLQDLRQMRQLRQFAIVPASQDSATASAAEKVPTAETRKRIKECLPRGCEFAISEELYANFVQYWFVPELTGDLNLLSAD